jgi:hypothetical protein
MRSLDDTNKKSFEIVEQALFCIALDEIAPANYDEVSCVFSLNAIL